MQELAEADCLRVMGGSDVSKPAIPAARLREPSVETDGEVVSHGRKAGLSTETQVWHLNPFTFHHVTLGMTVNAMEPLPSNTRTVSLLANYQE